MDTKRIASKIQQRHKTRDPFQIARELDYLLIKAPLIDVRGFYQYIKRCHIIYLDESLNTWDARFVCAHELGHSLLHNGMNRVFMDTRMHMATSRFENEADRFAVDLLFDDDELQELMGYSTSTISECLGVSYDLAEYRMGSVTPI